MDRRIVGIFFVCAIFAFGFLNVGFAANECGSGVNAYACVTDKPGYVCLPGSSSYTAQNVMGSNCPLADTVCKTYQTKCGCDKYTGYVEKNGVCVKTTCTYNGNTYNDGQCIQSSAPKRCVSGEVIDDSKYCGCPVGKTLATDGKTCTTAQGCRWNNPSCSVSQECKYEESNSKDEGHCVSKMGCASNIGTVKCTSMQYCDTSSNSDGVCVTKQGCKYSNPACSSGQICDTVSNTCVAKTTGSLDVIDAVDTPTAGASTSDGLSCCCAPTLGIVALAGFALVAKRRE